MARVYGIKKGLAQNNVDEKRIKEIIGNENLTGVIVRMEKLLDPGMMHEILDACACGGGKEFIKSCEKTGKEIADKTLSEKINHINSISPESDNIVLNDDNTLTVTWSFGDKGKNKCLCSAALTKGVKVAELALESNAADDCAMPLSYCLCCAGAGRRHLQLRLGVELKTKEILSSPINSRGSKPCQFVLEIGKG